jgi:cytoskeletal protein RodZ
MSIGATLAAARRGAGLTVGEVSDRTRIREIIIWGIEQDDYTGCGGDFYARGHIRAIAHVVGTDPEPLIEEFDATSGAAEITAVDAFQPVLPVRARERHRLRWTAALAVVALAVIGLASYQLVRGVGHAQRVSTTAASQPGTTPAHARGRTPSPAPTVTPSPSPTPSPAPARPLTPAGVAAFGPGGTADGDDPRNAALALGGDPARPWHSSWYTTARFGNLQGGTGLLVDMGHAVTVSSVGVSLAGRPGADIELRAGTQPALAGLPRVVGAHGAGGTVRFQLATPVRARYVLIWFTLLPPDDAGTYQAAIWEITVQGRP